MVKIPSFKEAKVLVVGDLMLDRYWAGDTSRISPEAPIPVVHVGDCKELPGGAANTALNAHVLGALTTLVGACGADRDGERLLALLTQTGMQHDVLQLNAIPTIVKLRVMSRNQQMLRLDFEASTMPIDRQQLRAIFLKQLPAKDVVILSDYAKGTLADAAFFIQAAREAQIPILVDPKNKSFELYRGATLITPNRKEFEDVVGICETDAEFASKGFELIQAFDLGGLLITRGAQGMTLLIPGKDPLHLPAMAREVFDVSGAGDTVIATLASAVACGASWEDAAKLANIAASISVSKLGASTVSVPELRRAVQQTLTPTLKGIFDEEALVTLRHDAKCHNERVVMTNGCFDILHAGHIQYLREAKALGDRLIVAVNSDASVKKLKGDNRPLNKLQARMEVLSALDMVDWVIPFEEETPQRIIEKISPDVLVKGGDYQVKDIAGHAHVLASGGDVRVLSFREGFSTTSLVNKIKETEE